MIKNEMLTLPNDWEEALELAMLKCPIESRRERMYICSPCRADTADGVVRNMKAARVYMHYAYQHFSCIPKAPHAYLPTVLNDEYRDERSWALSLGLLLLENCVEILVCGDKLTEGMYREIKAAINLEIPLQVFNEKTCNMLRDRLLCDGIGPEHVQYDRGHLHFALSWGADELAPYWEEESV